MRRARRGGAGSAAVITSRLRGWSGVAVVGVQGRIRGGGLRRWFYGASLSWRGLRRPGDGLVMRPGDGLVMRPAAGATLMAADKVFSIGILGSIVFLSAVSYRRIVS
jgi:hypothetical protein